MSSIVEHLSGMPAPLASSVPSELASPTFRQRSPRSAAAAARAAGAAEEARSGSADSAAAHAAPPPAGAAPPALAATSLQLLHLQEVLFARPPLLRSPLPPSGLQQSPLIPRPRTTHRGGEV